MKRRLFLSAALGTLALPACAGAPERSSRPVAKPGDALARSAADADRLVTRAGLGGRVGFSVADAQTGEILETHNPIRPLPPASVAKAVTALYALETLGADFRFTTRLVATGPIRGGRLDGDLVLVGGGDPALDTDGLADLAAQAAAAGLREVGGRLLVDGSALPAIERIDREQPDHVSYNPAIGGVNLNFNRVHFSWQRSGAAYATAMEARTERFRPGVSTSTMAVADRSLPVYTYDRQGGADAWTVARGQLGGEGSRWLPVRNPDLYAGDVLRGMLRANGIAAPAAQPGRGQGSTVAQVQSATLDRIAASMLRYSTNLVAEVIGLTATARLAGRPGSLAASGDVMSQWLAQRTGTRQPDFDDHSGLNGTNRIAANDMVRLLTAPGAMARLRPLLKEITLEGPPRQAVQAKTGTLNFVSGLAGYFDARSGRSLAFATFVADTDRRAALPVSERERPAGGQGWARTARSLQFDLIERWAAVHA
ncbi:D-alanyl-D-alanine carboxypeptidase/D-alanyl-D-alanine endopeptidase [Jannaschia rubra]|uniref:D-alanyl-D-alanine carboxypeptidase DacB n=1 Tax=Jannaschia rubra TaxID=282197 RepID=A0A0M6XQ21_9RHOB|nr:D-alanyl-D-alanine carboxypeptidase/D-alanyl-D-alanine-endopeptidase [Jannaschia rubra]CTQ33256.1 D-alanyl-D-alanine carboxypeptidase DacB precursor [Jannaschia rubra]SFF97923.1 D-alanyl-D-alanine carboxypeptidase / D-alanyl-D-alanine-endopeptidase (penicillin-binding protein 4) [Jannaschia rubra]